jgi:hypothetical protein
MPKTIASKNAAQTKAAVEIEEVPGPVAETTTPMLETFDDIAKRKGIPTPNANWIKAFAECQKSLQLYEQMSKQASEVGDIDSQQHFEALSDKVREQLMVVAGKLSTCEGCTGCGH